MNVMPLSFPKSISTNSRQISVNRTVKQELGWIQRLKRQVDFHGMSLIGTDSRLPGIHGEALLVAGPDNLEQRGAVEALAVLRAGCKEALAIGPALVVEDDADFLWFVTQDDEIYRRVFDEQHRSFIPNFGCYIKVETDGVFTYYAVTRQMVLFAVERRKTWRMLQSKAGVVNKDYLAQRAFLAKIDKGELSLAEAKASTAALIAQELALVS